MLELDRTSLTTFRPMTALDRPLTGCRLSLERLPTVFRPYRPSLNHPQPPAEDPTSLRAVFETN